jgi:plasmid maintenance system antidote protein VapI
MPTLPAEYASKPLAVFTKLAAMLRIVPAVRLVFAKLAALLRSKESGAPVISELLDGERRVTTQTADQPAAVLKPSSDHAIAAPETNDQSERENLIRRRWSETGINKESGAPVISELLDGERSVTTQTADQSAAVLKPSSDHAIAAPETNDQSERENLIRRRWSETGIKLWNPRLHGAGHAALNIQGQIKLLPPNPGQKLPRYDTLEFKMVRSNVNGQAVDCIVCEGVIVDPPKRRA